MKKIIFLLCLFPAVAHLSAQQLTELWNGLRTPQSKSELPQGKAPYQTPVRKVKKDIPAKLLPAETGEWIIAEGWELSESTPVIESKQSIFDHNYNTSGWYNATVPGTVLTTLVEQGVYPDPYFGLNNLAIPDTLCRMDWWYRISFEIPQGLTGKQIGLLFNGINYKAEVFLNAKKLGNIAGAFIRGEFDITEILDYSGKNILAVHILPPNNPGIPHEQSMIAGQGLNGGQLSLDGPTFISSIGWDWIPGIRDRNIGIWQDVRLVVNEDVVIIDPQIISNLALPDTSKADITLRALLRNKTNRPANGVFTASLEGMVKEIPYDLQALEEKTVETTMVLNRPKLWWPNGYGGQPLYHMELAAKSGDVVSDAQTVRFGIREMSYELMVHSPANGNCRVEFVPVDMMADGRPVFDYDNRVRLETEKFFIPALRKDVDEAGLIRLPQNDPVGAYLVVKVNGVRIFCRGGNWGMDDGMKRSSRDRLEPYVRLHREAGFNMIRNWTGESAQESFYSLCDEYGMLVWNDFWITTDDTVSPNDQDLFMRNATDAVRRFRNHPSIALWCPRNEGFAPKGLSERLTFMLAKEDPTRHYHGQSRFLNMGTSGPWGYYKDPSRYYTDNAKGFNTEMGSFAVPVAGTVRKFIAEEDLWPINDVWAYHDMHCKSQNFPDFIDAVNRYGQAAGMEEFAKKSQMVTYDAWRNMLEAWNSKMWGNTTGLLLWMSHPAWPSMIWQTYTYDYETPGSYFGAKKACEPLHVQMNLPDNDIMVVNTTRNSYENLDIAVTYYDLSGKQIHKEQKKTGTVANGVTGCFTPSPKVFLPDVYLIRLELKNKNTVLSVNDYWKVSGTEACHQFNTLGIPGISMKAVRKGGKILLEIRNNSNIPAVAVKLYAKNADGGNILPAYFSDGYFNLLPKENRKVEVQLPVNTGCTITAEGYNFTEKIFVTVQ
jgi:hypothetical protein